MSGNFDDVGITVDLLEFEGEESCAARRAKEALLEVTGFLAED